MVRKYGKSKVIDFSDWGRPIARVIAKSLEKKPVSVIQVTNFHLLLSLFGAWLILEGYTIEACSLLVVKGVIDAVDGELARIRQRPSHVGRYWDTIADTVGIVCSNVCLWNTFELGTYFHLYNYFGHLISVFIV